MQRPAASVGTAAVATVLDAVAKAIKLQPAHEMQTLEPFSNGKERC